MKSFQSYIFGIVVSFLLAGWLSFLGLSFFAGADLGWNALALVLGAIYIGGPLAVLLIVTWIVYLVRSGGKVPGPIHALLILPTFGAMMIFPIGESIKEGRRNAFNVLHPPITETHVNLSGQDLGLKVGAYSDTDDSGTFLASDGQDMFLRTTRYPSEASILLESFPYESTRLKDSIKTYSYIAMGYLTPPLPARAPVPLHRGAYPDLAAFLQATGEKESSILSYLYFHYADHVDVMPAIGQLSGSQELRLESKDMKGLVLFSVYNYLSARLARLEVNGQTLDFGSRPVDTTPPLPVACHDIPTPAGGAFIDPAQTITVRWQTLSPQPAWQTARITIPHFRNPLPEKERSAPLRVMLYLLPDATVAAERFLEIGSVSEGNMAIRATGLPQAAQAFAACGGAYERYNPQVVKLLKD